ncbi:HPF/RaiA family ribosome-associated protein [Pseudomonadota bacterium]|nr:HPF/RaiA family ribosome-associated protein [Pseudomonadota bacterium]
MQIDIQARSFTLTTALKEYAELKLKSSLSGCQDRLRRVVIRLSDINGPRGGEDKHCHIQVVLPGMSDVIIEDTEENMYSAIDKATDRASSAVTRKVSRKKNTAETQPTIKKSLDGLA